MGEISWDKAKEWVRKKEDKRRGSIEEGRGREGRGERRRVGMERAKGNFEYEDRKEEEDKLGSQEVEEREGWVLLMLLIYELHKN